MLRRAVALTVVLTLTGPLPLAAAATRDATFVRRANAVCRTEGAKAKALPMVTDANAAVVVGRYARIVDELVRRLHRIDAPKAKASTFRGYLRVLRTMAADLHRSVAAIKRGDAPASRSWMSKAFAANQHSDSYAIALGLTECAKDR